MYRPPVRSLERCRHLGQERRVAEALAEHQVAEAKAREQRGEVGQKRPALDQRPSLELQVVLDPDGRELWREHLEDAAISAEPVVTFGIRRQTLQSEVGHGAS